MCHVEGITRTLMHSTTAGSTRTRWEAYCGSVSAGILWPNGNSIGMLPGAIREASLASRRRRTLGDGDKHIGATCSGW